MEGEIQSIINSAERIVVIQADNPDADSLASSLALEQMLAEQGKKVYLYCGVEIPGYLKHMPGWDRVQKDFPSSFDASIIIDTSSVTLLEQLEKSGGLSWLKGKPCIVIDHHMATDATIDFATVMYVKEAVAAGELLFKLSNALNWPRNLDANEFITSAIMSDSLGLTSEGTSSNSIRVIAEMVDLGVSIPKLENRRRAMHKKSPELLKYKGRLLERVEYSNENRLAYITIPWDEIEKYSHEYNPSILVLDEMRMVDNVCMAIAFKTYPDGRITAKLRANYGFAVAAETASHFGGGGHPYAAGFKVTDGQSFEEVKKECLDTAGKLIDKLIAESKDDETTQYTYSVG